MTKGEAINWIINLTADIGKMEHRDLWHYEQALEEIRDMIEAMPSAQRKLDEWCKDCKEYDQERHCCPRFNRVIRTALDDAQPERIRGRWEVTPIYIKCSECGECYMLIPQNYCPNCGADMRG